MARSSLSEANFKQRSVPCQSPNAAVGVASAKRRKRAKIRQASKRLKGAHQRGSKEPENAVFKGQLGKWKTNEGF